MLPYSGQGAASAIEDGVSLGVMLEEGVSVEDVPQRLKLYQEARMQRAYKLQDYSRGAGNDLISPAGRTDTVGEALTKLAAFVYGHDELHHSQHVLREHLQSRNPQGVIWRSPVAFGPMPGPRQDFFGASHDTSHSSYRSISLRMKTSRTLLQNLLPRRDVLSVADPKKDAEMTWKYQSNSNMAWLGGGTYAHFSLYMHGVQCKKPDGSVLVGDYLAIMLEDKADPIITGRDEIGFPKLFCDLAVSEGVSDKHTTIRASWGGFDFATMRLNDPKPKDMTNGVAEIKREPTTSSPSPPPHAGLLVHRYIPAVGKKDSADADYIVCVPPAKNDEKPTVERTWTCADAGIILDQGDWKSLPTLHHIVNRLEELPDLGIVQATIAEGKGVGSHKDIYRVF